MFNRDKLDIKPLLERKHDLHISIIQDLVKRETWRKYKGIKEISRRIILAREKGSSTVFMMGAHVIRSGVQQYIIDLIKRGYISCIAMNGAGIIHDFEFSLIGATTESVARYIKEGQFGLWKETGYLNDIINRAYKEDKHAGMGTSIGKYIEESGFPYKAISILASAYRYAVPVTVHVGIGYDIIHEHPNCDGASTGALSYNDFLTFVSVIQNLEHGVVMNFGSAIMAPEVYLKALSMARNIACQEGREIKHFSTMVCDLINLPDNIQYEPSKDEPAYYFRPFKTMLIRTVADGGESFYIRGSHSETIPALWTCIGEMEEHGTDN